MNTSQNFARRIRPSVLTEIAAAKWHHRHGNAKQAFTHLERAHVLGQASTVEHVRVHMHMLIWAARELDVRELAGQIGRIIGGALTTWFWIPLGNTGGSNVSGIKPMPIPDDLQKTIDAAKR